MRIEIVKHYESILIKADKKIISSEPCEERQIIGSLLGDVQDLSISNLRKKFYQMSEPQFIDGMHKLKKLELESTAPGFRLEVIEMFNTYPRDNEKSIASFEVNNDALDYYLSE